MKLYQETLSAGVAARKSRGQIVTMLRDATGEVTRDMQRVVNTELQNARTEATADYLTSKMGKDVAVIVRPAPDACPRNSVSPPHLKMGQRKEGCIDSYIEFIRVNTPSI